MSSFELMAARIRQSTILNQKENFQCRQSLTRHARLLTKTDDHFSEFVARLGVKASGIDFFPWEELVQITGDLGAVSILLLWQEP